MSLAELMPAIRMLPREDQLELVRVLSADLAALDATITSYPAVSLLFAWSRSTQMRLILGQTSFFHEFDVSFYRSQDYFVIEPKP